LERWKVNKLGRYKRCVRCGYHFKIPEMGYQQLKREGKNPNCPSCNSALIVNCLKVEYAKYKGLMDKQLWNEASERELIQYKFGGEKNRSTSD